MRKSIVRLMLVAVCMVMVSQGCESHVEAAGIVDTIKAIFCGEQEENESGKEEDEQVSSRGSQDPMEELQERYPGYMIVDGQSDNDIIFEELCEALDSYEDQIVIYNCKPDIFTADLNKFHAASDYKYFYFTNMKYSEYEDYFLISFQYIADKEEIERMISEIDSVHRDIQYDTMNYDSEWEVAEYVYNYLVREVTYDQSESGANIRNIYGAMVEKKAVCAGYAMAFDYIMSRLGYQVGIAGNEEHMWNYIYWNSPDVFLDATWGDPDTYDQYQNHYINMSYMAFDAYEIETLESHEIDYCYISGRGYDKAEVDREEFFEGTDPCDYCDVCGYNAGNYSADSVERIFQGQYDRNDNSLIVKFDSTYELNTAVTELTANNNQSLNKILTGIGYNGSYSYDQYENLKTFVVYIKAE